MGSKSGYADTILRVLGLVPGQRAAAYLWCEPDPGVRLLLEAYRDGALAKAAAAIIRSWAAEDPRALWERLRAEGPPRCPDGGVEAGEVARWVWTWGRSYNTKGPDAGFLPSESSTGTPVWNAHPPEYFADAVHRVPALPAAIALDARQVDPREVARWGLLGAWSFRKGEPESGFNFGYVAARPSTATEHGSNGRTVGLEADMWERLPQVEGAGIHPDARAVDPGPALPPGTVCYMDPPYVGTTGYAADLPRAEVVALARRWAAAGAAVCVSEAEAIPELVAEGWHAVRIDGERVGQRRTFSRQQAEWLTLNRAPAWVPSVQGALFGGAR
jgi:hypothetical protein